MKTAIYKYEVQPGEFSHEIPGLIQLLTVQMRGDIPQFWAVVIPEAEPVTHKFHAYGTGHDLSDNPGRYIGTFQMDWTVFHLFYEGIAKGKPDIAITKAELKDLMGI